ncbi:MAG: hypothetical protein RMI91_04620 [Gemmatales bacterium]|nr:hypothetical protein [Gemmatales bacterium]MDW7993920.1 hypothetical protein [Gemmatales bacterium]
MQSWVELVENLERHKVAHGDLQHGNVLVVQDHSLQQFTLKLVDYDGMFVPRLRISEQAGDPVGHEDYNPLHRRFGPTMDRFPALVIYTALRALAFHAHELKPQIESGNLLDERLLFRKSDFVDPDNSELLRFLRRSRDATLRKLAQAIAEDARKDADHVRPLRQLLAEPQVPPQPSQNLREVPTGIFKAILNTTLLPLSGVIWLLRVALKLTRRLSVGALLAGLVLGVLYVFPPIITEITCRPDPPWAGEPVTIRFASWSTWNQPVEIQYRFVGESSWRATAGQVLYLPQVNDKELRLEFRAVRPGAFPSWTHRRRWRIQVPSPFVEIVATEPPSGPIAGEPFIIRVRASSPLPHRRVKAQWRRYDFEPWQEVEGQELRIPSAQPGQLVVQFRAQDEKGYLSNVVERYWDVPLILPTVAIAKVEPQGGPIAGEPFRVLLHADSPLKRPVQFQWRYSGEFAWRDLAGAQWLLEEFPGKPITVEFRARDSLGYTSEAITQSWEPRIIPPTAKLIRTRPEIGPVTGHPLELAFAAHSPLGRAVFIEWRFRD